jgi:hypothetical protein
MDQLAICVAIWHPQLLSNHRWNRAGPGIDNRNIVATATHAVGCHYFDRNVTKVDQTPVGTSTQRVPARTNPFDRRLVYLNLVPVRAVEKRGAHS